MQKRSWAELTIDPTSLKLRGTSSGQLIIIERNSETTWSLVIVSLVILSYGLIACPSVVPPLRDEGGSNTATSVAANSVQAYLLFFFRGLIV